MRNWLWTTCALVVALGLVSCSKSPPAPSTTPAASVPPPAATVIAATPTDSSPPVDEAASPDGPATENEPDEEISEEEQESAGADSWIDLGLDWIVRHQFDDGHWQFDHSQQSGGATSGIGRDRSNMAATAMAVLALSVKPPEERNVPTKSAIDRALAWMIENRRPNGQFLAFDDMHPHMSHGLATIAACNALRDPKDRQLERAVKAGVEFSRKEQLKNGAWPAMERDDQGSLEATAWHLAALNAGKAAGIELPPEAFEKCRVYLESIRGGPDREQFVEQVQAPVFLRRSGGTILVDSVNTDQRLNTATGQGCRLILGVGDDDPSLLHAADYLLAWLPSIDRRDCQYWYFASAVFRHAGRERGERWRKSLRRVLVQSQVADDSDRGSWDPARPTKDTNAAFGGRHLVTCFSILSFGEPKPASATPQFPKSGSDP